MLHDDVFQRERQSGGDDKTTTLFGDQRTGPLAIDGAGQHTVGLGGGAGGGHVVDIDNVVVIALFGLVFRAVKRVAAEGNKRHKTAGTGTGVVANRRVVLRKKKRRQREVSAGRRRVGSTNSIERTAAYSQVASIRHLNTHSAALLTLGMTRYISQRFRVHRGVSVHQVHDSSPLLP